MTRWDILGVLALGLLVIVSYFPAFRAGFVWDDIVFTGSAAVRDVAGLSQIWFSPSSIEGEGHYWPLIYSTFWLEHKLWGYDPVGYHIVNVVLHLVNTLLLWCLLARLTVPGAWVVAAVFAVHPLHVESVAWVMGRKDLLSALFYLAAFYAYTRFVEERSGWGPYVLALSLFALGMLCKSIVVTLPVALLLGHYWKRGRITGADVLGLMPFFAVGLGMAVADVSYSKEAISIGYSMLERVLIAAHALWFYLGKLLWPGGLIVIYPHWEVSVTDPWAWGYVVAGFAVVAALYSFRHRIGRGPLVGALFFAVTLSPVLGFVDYGYMQFSFVADRYQYLAGIGVMAVLVGAAAHGAGTVPGTVKLGVGAAALIVLGTLTWQQAAIYRNEETFFRYIIAHNPTARNAHLNLGKALFESGREEEGLAATQTAVELRPDAFKAHYNVGVMLMHLNRFDEAEHHLRRTLALNPDYLDAHFNAGMLLSWMDRSDEAEQHYLRTLELDPTYFQAHTNLGAMLVGIGRFTDAARHLRRALALNPHDGKALQNLAVAQLRQGRYAEALALYKRVVERMPNARVYADMATAFYYLGRIEEALESLDRALSLDPTLEDARANREALRQAKATATQAPTTE